MGLLIRSEHFFKYFQIKNKNQKKAIRPVHCPLPSKAVSVFGCNAEAAPVLLQGIFSWEENSEKKADSNASLPPRCKWRCTHDFYSGPAVLSVTPREEGPEKWACRIQGGCGWEGSWKPGGLKVQLAFSVSSGKARRWQAPSPDAATRGKGGGLALRVQAILAENSALHTHSYTFV